MSPRPPAHPGFDLVIGEENIAESMRKVWPDYDGLSGRCAEGRGRGSVVLGNGALQLKVSVMSLFSNYRLPVYTCKNCNCSTSHPVDHDEEFYYCPYCEKELVDVVPVYRDPLYITVAVYTMYQSYGGPEEGGWWYWEYDLIPGTQRSFLAEDAPQAEVYKDTLLARWTKEVNVRYSIEQRVTVRIFPEQSAAQHLPEHRPYYL